MSPVRFSRAEDAVLDRLFPDANVYGVDSHGWTLAPVYDRYSDLLASCDMDMLRAARSWYSSAWDEAKRMSDAGTYDDPNVWACVIAHLSPRMSWERNLEAAWLLANGENRPAWCLPATWGNAYRCLLGAMAAEDPVASFSARAIKTREFARSIIGYGDAVCIDTHMIHAALTEQVSYHELDSTAFRACTKALTPIVRETARRHQLTPATAQAAIWLAHKHRKFTSAQAA